jgi:AcrR family transcriptional regulator
MTTPAPARAAGRPGPRERLLAAARELTYTHGVGVGVDAILETAGVARRSLYQHFGGKDRLLAEVLHETAEYDLGRFRDALADGGTDPRARLRSVFDSIAATIARPGFHGCRYAAADLGLPAADHPAHAESRAYKQSLHDLLGAELRAAGHPDPDDGAEQLAVLIDGALASAITRPPAAVAKATRVLLDDILAAVPST